MKHSVLFRPFRLFLAQYLTTSNGDDLSLSATFSGKYAQVFTQHPRKPRQTFGESRFFVRIVAMVVHANSKTYQLEDLAANSRFLGDAGLDFFYFTKSPRESFLVADDCCPLHPSRA